MPANWGAFIPALANTLQSQQFTKPGGAKVSYDPPEIGATKVLGKDFKLDDDGNPQRYYEDGASMPIEVEVDVLMESLIIQVKLYGKNQYALI